jgi:L-lactate dehydrogenase complex protein LldG
MSSREQMLEAIRRQQVPPRELPSLDQAWITYADRFAQFKASVEFVGGRCFPVANAAEATNVLADTPAYRSAKQVVSLVPGVGQGNVSLDAVADSHELETIDFAIVPGQFAVAENGAIWINAESVKHRAIYFICQHLGIVVPRDQLLDNMHQAYQRLSFPGTGFGVFISGPSKTADIEQSLVIGAHGPRSLTVFCVG